MKSNSRKRKETSSGGVQQKEVSGNDKNDVYVSITLNVVSQILFLRKN